MDVDHPRSGDVDEGRLQDLVEVEDDHEVGGEFRDRRDRGDIVDIGDLDHPGTMPGRQGTNGAERAFTAEERRGHGGYRRGDLGGNDVEAQPEGHAPAGAPDAAPQLGEHAAMLRAEPAREEDKADLLAHFGEQSVQTGKANEAVEMAKRDTQGRVQGGRWPLRAALRHHFRDFRGPGHLAAWLCEASALGQQA